MEVNKFISPLHPLSSTSNSFSRSTFSKNASKWLRANHHFAVVIQNQSLAGHRSSFFLGGSWYLVGRSFAVCWWISHSSGLVWAFCCLYCLVNDLIYLFIHISTSVCLCLFVCLFDCLFEQNRSKLEHYQLPIVIEWNLKTNHTTTTKHDVDIRSWNTPNMQGGPQPVVNGVITPIRSVSMGFITPVIYIFLAICRAPKSLHWKNWSFWGPPSGLRPSNLLPKLQKVAHRHESPWWR